MLTGQTVTDEVLDTVLAEVAALLNGRPLTHVSVDPEDLEPLTPNHFLLGRPQPHLPPAPESSCHELSKREWRQAQALIDQFWRRWMEEYVPTLIERSKWLASHRNLQEGDVVLVVEPNTPRGIWPMGRVQQVHPGPDGVVRVATVRTMTGIYVRPVSKLCIPLKAKRDPACLPTAVVTVPPLSLLPSHQELRSSEPQRPPLSNQQLLPLIPRETPHLFFCFLILILFIFSSENDCTYLFCFSLLFLDYSFAFVIQTKGPL